MRRSEYEAQIRKLEEKVRELELQLSVARAVAASAHGDAPPALPMMQAVPIEQPKPKYTPCTAPPTIPLVPPLDGPNATRSTTGTPTPPLPAAAAQPGLRRRKRSDPGSTSLDVTIADALTRPPSVALTADDVLATLGL